MTRMSQRMALAICLALTVMMQSAVASEPGAFTWKSIFPNGLINAQGEEVDPSVLDGKLVGLFFSAQWCPPCRQFTPVLVDFRNTHQDRFEVVLVSHDRSDELQRTYMTEHQMPWPGLPQSDARTTALKEEHSVSGIPTLIVLSSDGKVMERDARMLIQYPPSVSRREQTSGNETWEEILLGHYEAWSEVHAPKIDVAESWNGQEPLRIQYAPRQGVLGEAESIYLHHGFDGWSGDVLNQEMTQVEPGVWEFAVARRPEAAELNFCFASGPQGAEGTRWDNNGGTDWRVPIVEE